MKTADKSQLMDNLAHYGYSLMRTAPTEEPEEVLTELLQQDDTRLLEGFPVVFVSGLKEKETLFWEKADWQPYKQLSKQVRMRMPFFLAITYLLLKLFGSEKSYQDRTLKLFHKFEQDEKKFTAWEEVFVKSGLAEVDGLTLSTERLKKNFRNYVVLAAESGEVQKKKHVLELELLLSKVFTSRQKELLKKRLEGKPFTKTEREYFYRVVKKRLRALANEELHQMARSVLSK